MLLIWDENPENIKTYLLPVESKAASWARKSSGLYINGDDGKDRILACINKADNQLSVFDEGKKQQIPLHLR